MASVQLETQHRAEAGHLLARKGMLWERLEAGIVDDPYGSEALQGFRECLGARALDMHANGERLEPTSNEERLERPERRSQHLVREPDAIEQPRGRRDECARHDVAGCAEVPRR